MEYIPDSAQNPEPSDRAEEVISRDFDLMYAQVQSQRLQKDIDAISRETGAVPQGMIVQRVDFDTAYDQRHQYLLDVWGNSNNDPEIYRRLLRIDEVQALAETVPEDRIENLALLAELKQELDMYRYPPTDER